jgi:4-amino-4-deoxy-L-arabinose transferase-like glycosyltransferase
MLRRAEAAVERWAPLLVVALVAAFAMWAWFASRGARFQFDELLEIAAAGASTPQQVISSLAAGVDFNPPLSHFIIRYSMAVAGPSEAAARLPAFLGTVALLISLYVFVARELGRTCGVLAMLAILCSPVRDYAVQARPYGLVLGFSGLILLCYRSATERRSRTVALIGVAICAGALTATHYYAVLVIGVLLFAELLRTWETKRPDWPLIVSCAAPPLLALWLLRDVIRMQRLQLAHYFSRGSLLSFDHGYDFLAMDPLVFCLALTLVAGALGFLWSGGKLPGPTRLAGKPRSSVMVLGLGLLLLPVAGALAARFVTHAYVPRYFLPAAIGFAICLCYCVKWFSTVLPALVLLIMLPFGLGFGKAILQDALRPSEELPASEGLAAAPAPLLFDTPGTYLQIQHYYPALGDKLWVIADPAASLRHRGYDTDDKIMLALAGLGRAQAITLSAAVRRWPHFSLVPRSADSVYALKCAMDAGAPVAVGRAFGSSNFVFEVTVPPESVARIDACTSPLP